MNMPLVHIPLFFHFADSHCEFRYVGRCSGNSYRINQPKNLPRRNSIYIPYEPQNSLQTKPTMTPPTKVVLRMTSKAPIPRERIEPWPTIILIAISKAIHSLSNLRTKQQRCAIVAIAYHPNPTGATITTATNHSFPPLT